MSLLVLELSGLATFQDLGRMGFQKYGVSKGGAIDTYALAEGQAILNNDKNTAALELQHGGGKFKCLKAIWSATSGGTMEATVSNNSIPWRTSFELKPNQILTLEKRQSGVYSYLHMLGGIDCQKIMGSHSTHVPSGLGECPQSGTIINPKPTQVKINQPVYLEQPNYFNSKVIRILQSPQSAYFDPKDIESLETQLFTMTTQRDRMGARINAKNFRIQAKAGLTLLSDPIIEGDIQVPVNGIPTILLADCQPTGGYPRIATVIQADLHKVGQLQPNESFRFKFVNRNEAINELARFRKKIRDIPNQLKPYVRKLDTLPNLLEYNLISGVVGENDGELH